MEIKAADTDGLLIHLTVQLNPEDRVHASGICYSPSVQRVAAGFRILQNRMNGFDHAITGQPFGSKALSVGVPMIQNTINSLP